ncbi:hypothetical protein [Frondihabitans cladoniiphilus]|uniref:Uncharacterized protein n=1 Tax=Frondihabitans cladoniiphilus TaxID=715785 RepID=A0ABP8WBU5_9MICO
MVLLMCVDPDCGGLAVSPERLGTLVAANTSDAREARCSSCGRIWSVSESFGENPSRGQAAGLL